LKTDEVRIRFLKFFENRGHRIVPSSSLIPLADPTLLFTGAGMNQFKEQFLGTGIEYTRAASCQKCLRTPDLKNVGRTSEHHTFFEMLGNFSFGDYFKEEAIQWAWEFLTKDLKIPKGKLSVSVYRDDRESFDIWNRTIGLDKKRIRRLGASENFWPANVQKEGPNGPCGPCTEIFYGDVEVWNLVLTQFDRGSDGILTPLPQKNVDTGMGLERLAACLQGKSSNFEIDSLAPIVDEVRDVLKLKARVNAKAVSHLRAISDHARAITFAISDGVHPSNEDRGYVIRKLIRLALTHAWCVCDEVFPFLGQRLVPKIAEIAQGPYPEIPEQREHIQLVIKREEENFIRIWRDGQKRWKDEVKRLRKKDTRAVDPEFIFQLHDTYGFPVEASALLSERYGLKMNRKKVDALLTSQRNRSRKGSRISEHIFDPSQKHGAGLKSTFLGYETVQGTAKITALLDERLQEISKLKKKERGQVFLDQTPFYAEQGGQVGDQGLLKGRDGSIFEVRDTQYAGQAIRHIGRVRTGNFKVGDKLKAIVNDDRRWHIRRNHTATHLLHSALRKILGNGVRQAGSLVNEEKIRFDFTHSRPVDSHDLERIEDLVNQKILENSEVATREMGSKAALKEGAIAFFGEKYGDRVRVVGVTDFSQEFCGGTHCRQTGDIGLFRITSEGSVGQGVRRIEAITGWAALRRARERDEEIRDLAKELKSSPDQSLDRARTLVRQVRELEKEMSRLKTGGGSSTVDGLVGKAKKIGRIHCVAERIEGYGAKDLRMLADRVRERLKDSVVVLANVEGDKVMLVVGVSKDLSSSRIDAGKIASQLAKSMGGSGGGRRDFAQAGGRDAAKLPEILEMVSELVKKGNT
jgi:alanyl-tRNA synthetase